FLISIIAHFWWIQALGAIYLLYMSIKNLISFFNEKDHQKEDGTDDHHYDESGEEIHASPKEFWVTGEKVEVSCITFVIDTMLAAIVLALTLRTVGILFGGLDIGQFAVMFLRGMLGVIIMRFEATWFVNLLNKYPGLECAAFAI